MGTPRGEVFGCGMSTIALGTGVVDIRGTFDALVAAGFDGATTLEIAGDEAVLASAALPGGPGGRAMSPSGHQTERLGHRTGGASGGITVPTGQGYRLYDQPVVAGYDPDPGARARMAADTPAATATTAWPTCSPTRASAWLTSRPRITARPDCPCAADRRGRQAVPGAEAARHELRGGARAGGDRRGGRGRRHGQPEHVLHPFGHRPRERALVEDRVVGEPSYAQLHRQYQFDTDYHPWFGKDERWWTAGLSVHHLGLLQLLFGPPETVYALTGPRRRQPG